MKIKETEFDLPSGRGAKRKARKKAFQNLATEGIRNYILVQVWSKKKIYQYEVMVYVEKETGVMKMQEFKFNGPKRKDYTYSETSIHRNDPRIPNDVRKWY
jgi:hypothetical protein